MAEPFLTASEIGEYAFCPEAWYLRRRKVRPSTVASERLRDGTRAHQQIGRMTDAVRRSRELQRLVGILLVLLLVLTILEVLANFLLRP